LRPSLPALLLLLAFCRQDMHDQPRYTPLEPSAFFADGRSARPAVEGAVPRGALRQDPVFHTGRRGGQHAQQIPLPVTRRLLARGQERFNIYCAPCHDRTGSGLGMIVRRGFRRPPSFHIERLRRASAGHFFDVITNGFGAMPDYAQQVAPRERWAIVAYVRALQLSQHAPVTALSQQARARLPEPGATPAAPSGPALPGEFQPGAGARPSP